MSDTNQCANNIMRKIIFISLGFLFLILALAALTLWRMPNLSGIKSLQDILPKKFLETIPAMKEKETELRGFISPDKKFKIEYPANWLTVDREELLKTLSPEEWAEKYNLQTLLLAQNFLGGSFSQLLIYGGTFEIPVEEIFDEMRRYNEKQGWTVEVVKLEIKENEGIFEGKYKNSAGTPIHSKEKILIGNEDGYLISIFALENDWQKLEQGIDKILNSAIMIGEK